MTVGMHYAWQRRRNRGACEHTGQDRFIMHEKCGHSMDNDFIFKEIDKSYDINYSQPGREAIASGNETSSNKISFSQYLPLFLPVRQLRAAVEPNLSLSQNIVIGRHIGLPLIFKSIKQSEQYVFIYRICTLRSRTICSVLRAAIRLRKVSRVVKSRRASKCTMQ